MITNNIKIQLTSVSTSINQKQPSILNYEDFFVFMCSNLIHVFSKKTKNHLHIFRISEDSNCSSLCKITERLIAVGTEDGNLTIIDIQSKKIISTIQAFIKTTVKCISTLPISGNISLILAASLGQTKSFLLSPEKILKEATFINFGTNFVETIEMCEYNQKKLAFISCCDFAIHIYSLSDNNYEFEYINSLVGHNNKIKSISLKIVNDDLFIASGSLDNYVRVWKSIPHNKKIVSKNLFEFLPNVDIELESVLLGHTEGVNCVKWSDKSLVSCSNDCVVLIWDVMEATYVNTSRFGQLYGNKNAILGIEVNKSLSEIFAYTVTGALLSWRLKGRPDEPTSIFADSQTVQKWETINYLTGHFRPVTDISWSSTGSYIISCSHDQTTRIFCQGKSRWEEIARAQIHGYDINTVLSLPTAKGFNDLLVCGGDEKVVRILEPLTHFINFHNLISSDSIRLFSKRESELLAHKNPLLYKISNESNQEVLGLMTKATEKMNFYADPEDDQGEETEKNNNSRCVNYLDNYLNSYAQNISKNEGDVASISTKITAPTEDLLTTMTLWPEVNKLYGHGYEISALATNDDGSILVSTCKSQSQEHAGLIFWDLKNYKQLYVSVFHNYTVLDIKFIDDLILTTGRDRNICLWTKGESGRYEPIFHQQAHGKIIYGLAIGFNASNNYFVSFSRDKTIKLWKINDKRSFLEIGVFNVGVSIHACDFIREDVICIGLENGQFLLFKVDLKEKCFSKLNEMEVWMNHGKCVNKIRRNPLKKDTFASCSDDMTVRIFEIQMD